MINRYIEYLISQSEAKDLQNRLLQLMIEELTEKFGESTSMINELLDEIRLLHNELSASESGKHSYCKKVAKLEEQMKAARDERYYRRLSKSKDDDND